MPMTDQVAVTGTSYLVVKFPHEKQTWPMKIGRKIDAIAAACFIAVTNN